MTTTVRGTSVPASTGRGAPLHVVRQRLAPVAHPVEPDRLERCVLEHRVERAADGRGELLDRRRAERRPEPAELEDQPRELVPGAAALAGRVVEPRWSLEREDADLGREVRREGGGQDLVVDDAHLVPLARGLEHGVDEIAALRAARPEAVEARG